MPFKKLKVEYFQNEQNFEFNFCACGRTINKDEYACNNKICMEDFNDIESKLIDFFDIFDSNEQNKAFNLFESYDPGIQAGILVNLEESYILDYIKMLDQEAMLKILTFPSDEFRLRFLEVLEPNLIRNIEEEFRDLQKYDTESLLDYFLHLINLILTSLQKTQK